jgi:hypothetical protein
MYRDYMLRSVQFIYISQYLIRQISTFAKFTAVFAHQQRYSELLMLTERSI